uniref:Carbonic anhydrase n=1 Tax=Pundamilia nyererei TaxID=303518 RepID=A0A3B4H4C7_9CICH
WLCSVGAWCYHLPSCSKYQVHLLSIIYEPNWSKYPNCSGTRQSPINIVSESAKPNNNLSEIHFENSSNIMSIKNNGETVQVMLESGVKISGGNLSGEYDTVQFHFHWGNGSSVPGSEHTVDGKRYPMELHIVNTMPIYNRNMTQAAEDPTGIAALAGFSLKDLLGNVSLSKYYRYLGSLTTPLCNEAVVWTVFKEPIKVSKDLIDLFSTTLHFNDSTSQLMTNIYRSVQNQRDRIVWTQRSNSSASTTCFSLGLLLLSLTLSSSWS